MAMSTVTYWLYFIFHPLRRSSCSMQSFNIGIKLDFPFINIRKAPREVLKTEGEARGFQHLPRDLANVNEWQNHIWLLLMHKFKENTPKFEKMFAHFILQPYHHFLTRAHFLQISSIRAVARYFFLIIWRLSSRFAWRPGECINIIQ